MSKKRWDENFSTDDYVYGTIENEFVRSMSKHFPKKAKVACFAEGEGRNAVYLASLGHEVTAYDQSAVGLQKAHRLANQKGVKIHTVAKDLTKERVAKDQYDVAVMIFGHVHKKDQPFFFENIIGALKPGGILLAEVYSKEQIHYKTGGPGSIDHLYDPVDLLRWTNKITVNHFYYGEAIRHEGKRHTGLCHLMQIMAIK